MTGFLEFGGLLFWLLIAFAGVWLFIAVGRSSPGWAMIPAAAIIYVFGWAAVGAPFPEWSLMGWVGAVVAYFLIGSLYAVAAWWVLVRRIRRYVDSTDSKLRSYDMQAHFKADESVSIPPQPGEFRSRIMAWIAYWPVAFVAYLVGDWLGDLVGRIYRWLTGVLGRISNSAFADYTKG